MQEYIEIRGVGENNLKNFALRIPKRKITIYTGVSRSGKSLIVFDTTLIIFSASIKIFRHSNKRV
jgi:excinuclease UvrABC ATPase subunit